MTQGEKLQREFDSAHNQTTNENEDDLAERHLASVREVFSVGGVWREIKLTARRKRPDEVFGNYIHLIKENVIPPETFESTRKRKLREAACQVQEQEEQNLARISLAYLQYKEQALDTFIKENFSPDHLATLVNDKEKELAQQDRWRRLLSLKQDHLKALAERQVRAEISQQTPFIQFEEFRTQYLRETKVLSAALDDLKSSNVTRDLTVRSSGSLQT